MHKSELPPSQAGPGAPTPGPISFQSDPRRFVAEKCGPFRLNPALVLAIIEQESQGNPWLNRYEPGFLGRYLSSVAVLQQISDHCERVRGDYFVSAQTERHSRAMSWGLLQIMGQTAREMAFVGPLAQLCDPEINLQVGCKYLARLIIHAEGNVDQALLAWNGGGDPEYPGKIARHMAGAREVNA